MSNWKCAKVGKWFWLTISDNLEQFPVSSMHHPPFKWAFRRMNVKYSELNPAAYAIIRYRFKFGRLSRQFFTPSESWKVPHVLGRDFPLYLDRGKKRGLLHCNIKCRKNLFLLRLLLSFVEYGNCKVSVIKWYVNQYVLHMLMWKYNPK